MLQLFTIRTRLLLGFVCILILAVGSITPLLLSKVNQVINESSTTRLVGLFDNMQQQIAEQARQAEELCILLAEMPEVQQAFAQGDRETLSALLVKPFQRLKQDYGLKQLQFHTPPATSFMRIHALQKHGDDLSAFRKTVVEANQRQVIVKGLESGVAGLGIRSVIPVNFEGRHIGSLEFGLNFGQPFFDAFKQKHNVDITMHLYQDGNLTPYAGTTSSALLPESDLKATLDGETIIRHMEHNDRKIALLARKVDDYSGNAVGVVTIAYDESHDAGMLVQARNAALLLALGVLAVGVVLSVVITTTIVKPLDITAASLMEIAKGEGDLRVRLPCEGNHELSYLSKAFNLFAEKIQHTVSEVQQSIGKLTQMAETLATNSADTRSAAAKQSSETEQVATALGRMTRSFQAVAGNAVNAANAAKEANVQANTGNQVVQQSIQAINRLAEEIEQSGTTIHGLETQSKQIGGILETIRNIADQTNLLALNAAIEAARAGEQGRGFAVVADEVRTLASRTQQATEEIQNMITTLQNGAQTAVQSMQSSQNQMRITVEQAEMAGHAFHSITKAIGTISAMNEQIARSSEEQTSVAEHINRNELRITEASRQAVQAAENVAKSSEMLAKLAENLGALLGKFKA